MSGVGLVVQLKVKRQIEFKRHDWESHDSLILLKTVNPSHVWPLIAVTKESSGNSLVIQMIHTCLSTFQSEPKSINMV